MGVGGLRRASRAPSQRNTQLPGATGTSSKASTNRRELCPFSYTLLTHTLAAVLIGTSLAKTSACGGWTALAHVSSTAAPREAYVGSLVTTM